MNNERFKNIVVFVISIFLSSILFFYNLYYLKSEIIFSLLYIIPLSLTLWFSNRIFSIIVFVIIIFYYLTINIIYIRSLDLFIIDVILKVFCFIYIFVLLIIRKNLFIKEQKNARTDKLTNVLNRFSLYEKLSYEINASRRNKFPLTVSYIDLDNFKSINDNKGHKEGDKLLMHFTSEIAGNLRQTDYISRLGGDEFFLVLPNTVIENSKILLNKLYMNINEMFIRFNWNEVSMSMVCCFSHENIPDFDKIISIADKEMYNIKTSGKNDIRYNEFN
jgi:diguanylate cyclase (GGDEF)-like protein